MTITFLHSNHAGVIAQESTTELSLGENLVRELWNDFKTQNISASVNLDLGEAGTNYLRGGGKAHSYPAIYLYLALLLLNPFSVIW